MLSLTANLKGPKKRPHVWLDGYNVEIRAQKDGETLTKRFCGSNRRVDTEDVGLIDTWRPRRSSTEKSKATNLIATAFAKEEKDAIRYAQRVIDLPEVEGDLVRLVFFVDASMNSTADPHYNGSPGAYSVVFKKPGEGNELIHQAWFIDKMFNNNWGELMAIAEALNMAVLRLRLLPAFRAAEVYIFTDSLRSIECLMGKINSHLKSYNAAMAPLRAFVLKLSHHLRELGGTLTLSHVPGHGHNLEGHKTADAAAYNLSVRGEKALAENQLPTAYDGNVDNNTTMAHNSIWSVLHHEALRCLADSQPKPPTDAQVSQLRELEQLLSLPPWRRDRNNTKKRIKSLRKAVGQFL